MSELIELKCKNCGSPDLKKENGFYVCRNCGSRFIPDSKKFDRADRYREKMLDALTADNDDYIQSDDEDEWLEAPLRRYKELKKYTEKLLQILPEDPYGWASRVGLDISKGLDSELHCSICVSDAVKTLEYAQKYSEEEELTDIAQFIYMNLNMYRETMLGFLTMQYEKDKLESLLATAYRLWIGSAS